MYMHMGENTIGSPLQVSHGLSERTCEHPRSQRDGWKREKGGGGEIDLKRHGLNDAKSKREPGCFPRTTYNGYCIIDWYTSSNRSD